MAWCYIIVFLVLKGSSIIIVSMFILKIDNEKLESSCGYCIYVCSS